MKSALAAALLGIAASAAGQSMARSFTIKAGGAAARVLVPKKFEPLLPGSVYPNRRKPVEARECPVAIVETARAFAKGLEEPLLERGFLVVEMETPAQNFSGILTDLAAHREADVSRAAAIFFQSTDLPLDARLRAILLFDPVVQPAGAISTIPAALFLRTPGRGPSDTLTRQLRLAYGDGAEERWYRGEAGFPPQALRDAAEWLFDRISTNR